MSSVYTVVSIKSGTELDVVEVYAGNMSAFKRAREIALTTSSPYPEWVIRNPVQETESDGSLRWVFLDTYKFYVAVHFKTILGVSPSENPEVEVVKKSYGSDIFIKASDVPLVQQPKADSDPEENWVDKFIDNFYDNLNKAVPPPPVVKDTPLLHSLPAGWLLNGKPATMADLVNNPTAVKHTYELTESQRFALVTARVSKRPGFSMLLHGLGTFTQAPTLQDLKAKTTLGYEIVRQECEWLDRVLDSHVLLQGIVEDEEEESSSSSDEEDED